MLTTTEINFRKKLTLPITNSVVKHLSSKWEGSAVHEESTLHQLSPYVGKMKSSMANALISKFTKKGEIVYDPFSGSGTVAHEAWIAGRHIYASDLNLYASVLTRAKLFPYLSVKDAIDYIEKIDKILISKDNKIDLRKIPAWVRSFYHPETLREIVAWSHILKERKSYYLLSCLLGILHHQRPGFLSYPSSHTVPYLREKKFPIEKYPELYEYRSLKDRLIRKVNRSLKRVPQLDDRIIRKYYMRDAAYFVPDQKVHAIITSPPYMRQLDYGRDNRLRLWFLGVEDWKALDHAISPPEVNFISLMKTCLKLWQNVLTQNGLCVFVLGDGHSRLYNMSLADVVGHLATSEVGGYFIASKYTEAIPNERRVRRGCRGSSTETILVLRKNEDAK